MPIDTIFIPIRNTQTVIVALARHEFRWLPSGSTVCASGGDVGARTRVLLTLLLSSTNFIDIVIHNCIYAGREFDQLLLLDTVGLHYEGITTILLKLKQFVQQSKVVVEQMYS